MKSRISFFDATAFRKDITRFAPVWALYLIGGLLVSLNMIGGYSGRSLIEGLNGLSSVNLLYAALCAQMLFGDLFNSKLCNALHALPLRRETWFVTHTAAGVAFSLIPNLILSLCFLPGTGEYWYLAFVWLLGMTLEYLFFFGVAVLSCMLSGNRIGMAAVYAVINFFSVIVYWFVDTFYAPLLVGLDIRAEGFIRFCPTGWIVAWLGDLAEFKYVSGGNFGEYEYLGLAEGWWYLAVLAVLGVVALVLGVLLYRRRKLESAGDLLTFKPMEPVFAVIATLSAGAVFQMIGQVLESETNYIYLIVGILVGYFASRMLLERRVKVFRKKAFLGCGAIVGVMALTLLLTSLDPLGVTRWVPEVDQVESVKVIDDYTYDERYDYTEVITITDADLIASLTEAHRALTEEGSGEWGRYTSPVTLIYQMKDGRQVRRHYYYPTDSQAAWAFTKLFSDPKYVLEYEDWDTWLAEVDGVNVDWSESLVGEEARQLLEAIKADCEAGTMMQNRSHYNYITSIQIIGRTWERYIDIFQDCENTQAWLKENLTDWDYKLYD